MAARWQARANERGGIMTLPEARKRARRMVRRGEPCVLIVWSPEETDPDGAHYHATTEPESDTYFFGAPVIEAVETGAH